MSINMMAGFVYLVLLGAFLAIAIMVGVYVYRDATRRKMNATLWTLIAVLAPALIGLIVYLVVRSDYSELQCPQCSSPITDQYVVCPNCGATLKANCTHCSQPLEPSWKICAHCGTPVPDDQKMPIVQVRKDKSLGKILIAVMLIPLLLMGILIAGLMPFRSTNYSISATGGMRVEDFQDDPAISAWLSECDAAGDGIYVLEYQAPNENTGFYSSYMIYRNGLTDQVVVSAEGQPKTLFSGSKLVVNYNADYGVPAVQDYHLYQIDYYANDDPKLEIFVNNAPAPYQLTMADEPFAFANPNPMRNVSDNLFDARIDYVGDNSGVINLIDQTELPGVGNYTIELMTSVKPYGLRINIDSPIKSSKDALFATSSIELLGLIKNLDYVEITDGNYTYKKTSDEASNELGFNVKELGQSRDALEEWLLSVSD